MKNSVIHTNKAECQDCYRCLRCCPVKAIEMKESQASINDDLCITCGTCIRECPQKAKSFRNDLLVAKELLAGPDPVAVSIAPSFTGSIEPGTEKQLISALRRLGFSHIAETSIGAAHVAEATRKYVEKHKSNKLIATACPAVVSHINKYHPELNDLLLPVVSPMIAHGLHIKKNNPGTKVVFIGPCLAKKAEADADESEAIDAALTFEELNEWLQEEHIVISEQSETDFDEPAPRHARLFPLEGGLLQTAGMSSDMLSPDVIAISGYDDLEQMIENLNDNNDDSNCFIEPLFCNGGCLNGPLLGSERNIFQRRRDLQNYAQSKPESCPITFPKLEELLKEYEGTPVNLSEPPEDIIKEILASTGKLTEHDELNCKACGYESCRDKAVAVFRGFAEREMCIPYMRRLAEQRTDKIIETIPNGIVIIDATQTILHVNPAFAKMFKCSSAICGRRLSYLIDPGLFDKVIENTNEFFEDTVPFQKYGLLCKQIVYKLPSEDQYVGIFINVTQAKDDQRKLAQLRSGAIQQAQDLLNHQIQMAQTMAQFLGETTAQGEALVEKIIGLAREEQIEDLTSGPNVPVIEQKSRPRMTRNSLYGRK